MHSEANGDSFDCREDRVATISDRSDRQIREAGMPGPKDGSCLILLMRHMGDAVITSGLINALQIAHPEMKIDILGRPELRDVAYNFGSCREYLDIDLPIYGHHRRTRRSLSDAIWSIREVRNRKYDFCINAIGDVREGVIGRISGAKWNIAPIWPSDHIFRKKMTGSGAELFTNFGITIPSKFSNYYDALGYFSCQLGLGCLQWKDRGLRRDCRNGQLRIALHPGASHASRHWPIEKWISLIFELRNRGHQLVILGSVSDRQFLSQALKSLLDGEHVELVTDEISGFISQLASVDALIGMDSFSVHAAYALRVPAVVLNGSADPVIMTPPGDAVVSAGWRCKEFPCYYDYPCRGTDAEYICTRGIEIQSVLSALDGLIGKYWPLPQCR